MKIVKCFQLLLLVLIVCSCRSQAPRQYFNRPQVTPVIANGDGTGFKDGELVSTKNMICSEPNNYQKIEDYFIDKETRLYFCLRFGDCE